MGWYAKPFDLLLKNSCINSASISYSIIPGLINGSIRLNPFSVKSHAFCNSSISNFDFIARNSCIIGATVNIFLFGKFLQIFILKRSSLVWTSEADLLWIFSFKYILSATEINSFNLLSNSSNQKTVFIPEIRCAFFLSNFSPSQIAICWFVSFKNKISLIFWFGWSGKITSTLSSWSIPESQKRSLFCLKGIVPSPFVGITSLEFNMAIPLRDNLEKSFSLFCTNSLLLICKYFISFEFNSKIVKLLINL